MTVSLEFFTVTGHLQAVVVDYVDLGVQPDLQNISATVDFIPRVPAGALVWAPGLAVPSGVALQTIRARFDTDGYLRTIQNSAQNERQVITITGSPTNYKLAFNGSAASATIAGNASASTVQTTLQALSTIGAGNVNVAGNPGGPYTVYFVEALAAQDVPLLVASAITGGTSPTVNIVSTQTGSLNVGVQLVANTAAIALDDLYYDCKFSNVVYGKADRTLDPASFIAPTTGGVTIDMASIEWLPPKPGL